MNAVHVLIEIRRRLELYERAREGMCSDDWVLVQAKCAALEELRAWLQTELVKAERDRDHARLSELLERKSMEVRS